MDQHFNREAAARAYDVVMKMDDATAEMFVRCVAHDLLVEDLTNNARVVSSLSTRIHKSIVDDLDRMVSKSAVDERLVVDVVSKALGDDKYNRDKSGRFATVESRVRTDRTKRKMPKSRERAQGIPSAKGLARESRSYNRKDKLSSTDRSAYQQQYLQLAEAMDAMTRRDGSNLRAILENKSTGRQSEIKVSSLDHITGWNPATHNLVATRFDEPRDATRTERAAASFDTVSALGSKGSAFEQRWNDASKDPVGTNARTYRRIEAGSKLVADVTPAGSKANTAARFGEFVGQYGPEAEKVVGPQMRKTAYRYRGTERAPDAALLDMRKQFIRQTEDMRIREGGVSEEELNTFRSGRSISSPEVKQMRSADAATSYLFNRLPNLRLSEIQRKSGRIPPSEGVIIDRDGNIATQAVGFADDHYLPFNLKNLKGLQGGQYVRTRSKGGLTSEDIYTGLVSGARRVTVVSNSGVFTINFEDDFRGGRRMNDKAASMVDRYEKTLDALKGGQIERQPLDPAIRGQLLEETERDFPPSVYSQAEIRAEYDRRVKDYKENPQLTGTELANLESEARDAAQGDERKYRQYRAELMDAALEDKRSRFYQLDGEGYAAALEALKEQYPYYIASVSFAHRDDAMNAAGERADEAAKPELRRRFKGGSDQGYVKPRYNRPEEALEGYYDSSITGSGKIAASNTNFQNWENNPTRGRTAGGPRETATETATATPAAAPRGDAAARAAVRQKVALEEQQRGALQGLVSQASRVEFADGSYPALSEAAKDFDAAWSDPAKRIAIETELGQLGDELAGGDPAAAQLGQRIKDGMRGYSGLSGSLGGTGWNAEQHLGRRSTAPYQFSEPAYQAGADKDMVQRELTKQYNRVRPVLQEVQGVTDSERAATAAASLGLVAQNLRSNSLVDAQTNIAQAGRALGWNDSYTDAKQRQLTNAYSDDGLRDSLVRQYSEAAEGLERIRALQSNQIQRQDAPTAGKMLRDPDPVAARQAQAPQLPQQAQTKPARALLESGEQSDIEMASTMLHSIEQKMRRDEGYTVGEDLKQVRNLVKQGKFAEAKQLAEDVGSDDPMDRASLKAIFGSSPAWD